MRATAVNHELQGRENTIVVLRSKPLPLKISLLFLELDNPEKVCAKDFFFVKILESSIFERAPVFSLLHRDFNSKKELEEVASCLLGFAETSG